MVSSFLDRCSELDGTWAKNIGFGLWTLTAVAARHQTLPRIFLFGGLGGHPRAVCYIWVLHAMVLKVLGGTLRVDCWLLDKMLQNKWEGPIKWRLRKIFDRASNQHMCRSTHIYIYIYIYIRIYTFIVIWTCITYEDNHQEPNRKYTRKVSVSFSQPASATRSNTNCESPPTPAGTSLN